MGSGTRKDDPENGDRRYFNPPAPWGAGLVRYMAHLDNPEFQSTRSVGSGTSCISAIRAYRSISIHPLRGERDRVRVRSPPQQPQFQSTRSVGSGTASWKARSRGRRHFNPPAPWGAGPGSRARCTTAIYFNPPAPWGAGLAETVNLPFVLFDFNPPAPWGAGLPCHSKLRQGSYFNPPAPWGAGRWVEGPLHDRDLFQSTRSVGSGTCSILGVSRHLLNFNPPAPWGAGRSSPMRLL